MTITDILQRFQGVKERGRGQWMAKCPAHDDHNPSLSIGLRDGKVLFNCHYGCQPQDIAGAVGLTMKDLFLEDTTYTPQPKAKKEKGVLEREHIYPDPDGKPLLKKLVFRRSDGSKECPWQRWENGKWIWGRGKIEPPLYMGADRLPEGVFLVEGEKDVETLKALGIAAVSFPDGAKSKWRTEYGDILKGHKVFIVQDNDETGKEFAKMLASNLYGLAASVKIMDLCEIWPELPVKGDTTDIIQHFGPEDGKNAMIGLAGMSAEWEPPKGADPFISCFKTLDEFDEEEATWLVPGWLPEGQITLMAADGGIGKTTLWCNLITALSNGTTCILDPPDITRKAMRVAFLTTEDSVRKKLKKKLRTAGANEKNILTPDFLADKEGLLRNLKFNTPEMSRFIKYFKPALCVFDPVQGFIPPDINMGSRNAMRDCLAPLISLGEECGTTFLIVCHTNKRKGAYGRDRIADSADLWDISRSVLMAGYTEDQGVRYLSNEKNNYTELQETMLFTIDSEGRVVREGTSWKRDREYIQEADLSRSAPKKEDCKEFILDALDAAGEPILSDDLQKKAKEHGYSFSTFKNARAELRKAKEIRNFKTGNQKGDDQAWYTERLRNKEFSKLDDNTPIPWDD